MLYQMPPPSCLSTGNEVLLLLRILTALLIILSIQIFVYFSPFRLFVIINNPEPLSQYPGTQRCFLKCIHECRGQKKHVVIKKVDLGAWAEFYQATCQEEVEHCVISTSLAIVPRIDPSSTTASCKTNNKILKTCGL